MLKLYHPDLPQVKCGDLFGFSGHNLISATINLATYGVPYWSLSHVAIVGPWQGRPVLFESTTLDDLPDLMTGKRVEGVQAHDIDARIKSYAGRVWHYPLTRPLFSHEYLRLQAFLYAQAGKKYDEVGAFRAGGLGWSALENLLHPAAKNALFCSEYCAAAHNQIGIFPTAYAARWSPNHLKRAERRMGLLTRPTRRK
jgi:hypothetical protein